MRRIVPALLLGACAMIPAMASHGIIPGYAEAVVVPQGDEFNSDTFTAPFKVQCATLATGVCPDPESSATWSLNVQRPGYLRIITQFGSLVGGAAQSSNNARNLVLQPFDTSNGFIATTSVTFPGTTQNITPLGQTAGLLVYQDDDHFIYVGRVFTPSGQSQIEFRQENGANNDLVNAVNETGLLNPTVYLRLVKAGDVYTAFYSYDNVNFTAVAPGLAPTATPTSTVAATNTPTATATATGTITPVTATATNTAVPTATSTPTPVGYIADYTTPQLGVFAWGGTNANVTQNTIPADFDWFRLGANSLTPVPTATATSTGTAVPTNTSTPVTPTSTAVATSTATATATATNTPVPPTATNTPLPTDTPVPTATPKPPKPKFGFQYVSVWYHYIHIGSTQHIQVQDKSHGRDGIWVTVQFASGKPLRWYQETDKHGFWQMNFKVPAFAVTRSTGRAVVTFQLWKGHRTTKTFETFYAIR